MRGSILAMAFFGVAMACWAIPAWACYSGLMIIPTTDTAGGYAWVVSLQYQTLSSAFKTQTLVLNTEFGIGDRVEIGFDLDRSPGADPRESLLLNGKVVLFRDRKHGLSCAAGITDMRQDLSYVPYVVFTEDLRVLRIHLGLQHQTRGGENNYFLGADRTFENGLALMADHTHGARNFTSVGLGWAITKKLGVFAGPQWPNAGGPPIMALWVIWTDSFPHR